MSQREALVLPGVGSPESLLYQDVYGLLSDGARSRGILLRCLKYKGHGHLADGAVSGQITLPGVAAAIAEDVRGSKPGSMLICRSFGCLLPGYLALKCTVNLATFERIVFWGPVPAFELWNLFGTRCRVAKTSVEAEHKGSRVDPDFYESLLPIEMSCKALVGTQVIFAVGTCDKHTTPEFANYLAATVRKAGNTDVSVRIVDGAPHEVTSAKEDRMKAAYLDAIFG